MTAPASAVRSALLGAARAILRPLVRQLIASGVTYPAFSRLAKEVYIDVGTTHFTLPFKKQTDSRVALVTGITRKEIGQIRRGQARPPGAGIELESALAARAVGRWLDGPPYARATGAPRVLPYESPAGVVSFVDLVAELGGDIPPRAVLDELLRAGAAALTPSGDVRLVGGTRGPLPEVETQLARLGADAGELIDAVAQHLEKPEDCMVLQRKVVADRVGAARLPALRTQVDALAADFAGAVERVVRDHAASAPGERAARAAVVVYYFDAPVKPPTGGRG